MVIIILESFAAEYSAFFNREMDSSETFTPFLDSLYGHSRVFEYAFSNGRKSIDAMPSVLMSVPRVQKMFAISTYATVRVNSIAQILNEKNYHSFFAHGAPTGSMGFDAMANLARFKKYYGMDDFGKDEYFDGQWGIWDDKFFRYFGELLDKSKQPFVGTIFSVTSHHPYRVPKEFEKQFPTKNKLKFENEKAVRYTDHSLRMFFNKVKNKKWYENTLFIITADHTNITKYKSFAHSLGRYRVPIAFYTPDGSVKSEFISENFMQQNDILPTILGTLGYHGKITAFGNNLSKNNGEENFSFTSSTPHDYQLIHQNFILYFDLEKLKFTGFYDYKKDTLLKKNLVDNFEDSSFLEMMKNKMKAYIQQYHNRMNTNSWLAD